MRFQTMTSPPKRLLHREFPELDLAQLRAVERLLEVLPLPGCVATIDGRPLVKNDRWNELMGERDQPWTDLVQSDDQMRVNSQWKDIGLMLEPLNLDCRLLTMDGGYRVQSVRITPLAVLNPPVWLIVLSDVSEAQSAKARLAEVLGFVSHEASGLLTTIRGNAAIISHRYDSLSDEQKRCALADILEDSERLRRMMDGLSSLARVEGQETPALESLSILPVIQGTVARHMKAHPHRPVNVQAPRRVPPVLGIGTYLEEIIFNFIENAEKYSPEPTSPIDVIVETRPETVAIAVLDRGNGIQGQDVERLFVPWVRGTGSSQIGGSGIGLSVCRRLTEIQRGNIWASPRSGGGAEFGVSLRRALPLTNKHPQMTNKPAQTA